MYSVFDLLSVDVRVFCLINHAGLLELWQEVSAGAVGAASADEAPSSNLERE